MVVWVGYTKERPFFCLYDRYPIRMGIEGVCWGPRRSIHVSSTSGYLYGFLFKINLRISQSLRFHQR